jgi:hypothetical protein
MWRRLSSSVAVDSGARFERLCAAWAQAHGIALSQGQGSSHDQGIDLRGRWMFRHQAAGGRSWPVVVQCKHYHKVMTSSAVREFIGALAPYQPAPPVALLMSATRFSDHAIAACHAYEGPLLLLQLGQHPDGSAVHLEWAMFNHGARRELPFVSVGRTKTTGAADVIDLLESKVGVLVHPTP